MTMKTPWWKYVLSVLAFIILFFVAPLLVDIAWRLATLFAPSAFKSSAEWINIVSTAIGVGIAIEVSDRILSSAHPKFSMVLSIICAFYMIAVGVWNFACGATTVFNMIAMFAGAVVSVFCAVQFGKLILKDSKASGD